MSDSNASQSSMPLNDDPKRDVAAVYEASQPETQAYIGDCRNVLRSLPERGQVDLIFADPPFNWSVAYEQWDDSMPREDYEDFTREWLDGCLEVLAPNGSIWVNIPDDSAAEIVMHLKQRGMHMINWCIWHFRFGQHREGGFINSKVHALYFSKDRKKRTWNGDAVLEQSDRAAIYGDKRTMAKTKNQGMRVPMDVWYGKYWGRIQGNNKERRPQHQNQIPEVYLERVILACSNPGDLVLDPFLGSGTTLTVARAHGRRSIGIEYSPETASSAWQRITEIGMLRKDIALGQSTAIFERR
ncbi:MAG: DNA methyltransferase [Phycisphaerales bacterium]|nr:DNA methyltransferase [Phycisphaerales bacterium]